jgi:hypothetical protein
MRGAHLECLSEFFDVTDSVALELTKGKERVTVKSQARPNNYAGGVFGVRAVEKRPPETDCCCASPTAPIRRRSRLHEEDGGRGRHSVRAVGNGPDTKVGIRGAPRTDPPYPEVHGEPSIPKIGSAWGPRTWKTPNIEHRTSNVECDHPLLRSGSIRCSTFGVRCSMLLVPVQGESLPRTFIGLCALEPWRQTSCLP